MIDELRSHGQRLYLRSTARCDALGNSQASRVDELCHTAEDHENRSGEIHHATTPVVSAMYFNGGLAAIRWPERAARQRRRTHKMSEKSMPAGWSERCGNRSLIEVCESDGVRWAAQWADARKTQCLEVRCFARRRGWALGLELPVRPCWRNSQAPELLACTLLAKRHTPFPAVIGCPPFPASHRSQHHVTGSNFCTAQRMRTRYCSYTLDHTPPRRVIST